MKIRDLLWGPPPWKRALDSGRSLGPTHRQALKREQLVLVDRLIRHEFRNPKPPSNPVLVKRYYIEYRTRVAFANGTRNASKKLATRTKGTFSDYVKEIGAFYRDSRWRAKHL